MLHVYCSCTHLLHFPHCKKTISLGSPIKAHQQLLSLSSATWMSSLGPYPTGVNWADIMHHIGSITEVGGFYSILICYQRKHVRSPFISWPGSNKSATRQNCTQSMGSKLPAIPLKWTYPLLIWKQNPDLEPEISAMIVAVSSFSR